MAIRTVYSSADTGAGTLRDALTINAQGWSDPLQDGDVIDFSDSLEDEQTGLITITFGSTINLPAADITIDGGETWTENGVLKTRVVLDGQNTYRLFAGGNLGERVFTAVTFKNGYASNGGAILANKGNITFENCAFIDNNASSGGAFYANSGNILIKNCFFSGNGATSYGKDIYVGGLCQLEYNNNTSLTTDGNHVYYNATETNETRTGHLKLSGVNSIYSLTLGGTSTTYISGHTTIAYRLGANSGAAVIFDGVDSVLTIKETFVGTSATYFVATDSTGYLALPDGTPPPTVGTGVHVATYSTATPTISATITNRDASVDIKNAGSGYITEVEYADGTVDDLTITEGAAEIAVDKAFKIRLFNGAFYYSPFVPRTYYLKTYDVDGDFATAADWTLDAQKTLTCNAAPTIQNGTFYCTAPEV